MSELKKRYRKKPVVVEAIHWRADLTNAEAHALTRIITDEWDYPWLVDGSGPDDDMPARLRYRHNPDVRPTRGIWIDPADGALMIRTLEGDMRADLGDWIIRGVKGEVYPCKPDIFAATYEEETP